MQNNFYSFTCWINPTELVKALVMGL